MESRLEEIFSIGISCMSLAVWLVEDRKCSAAVVGLDLALGLSMVRRCSLFPVAGNMLHKNTPRCKIFHCT